MKIKELRPNTSFDEIIVEVVTKGEPRAFASASGQGTVCNAAVKDEDGEEISLTLWNDDYKKVNDGDKLKITNGWVTEYKGRIQISSGKKGTLEVIK
ncbi:MAG: DNA-binding protein [Candidatus ainarchaeum sp.]|jgi:replication factor A1|nr:DNA-binding protein [Candidatus ainarchaeum sp.]MDD3085727.1 DNA-binding protein [Candidatus ainarchaeum sp.]MDD4128549.1 DNA-binding protein [Candidatus ainarchaeum sp.]MDD4467804.1 DNA-binding protein [Candidatus ainarchaeum sp.]HPM85571.1 DNA-binding protein [archaeon]